MYTSTIAMFVSSVFSAETFPQQLTSEMSKVNSAADKLFSNHSFNSTGTIKLSKGSDLSSKINEMIEKEKLPKFGYESYSEIKFIYGDSENSEASKGTKFEDNGFIVINALTLTGKLDLFKYKSEGLIHFKELSEFNANKLAYTFHCLSIGEISLTPLESEDTEFDLYAFIQSGNNIIVNHRISSNGLKLVDE